MSRFSWLLVGVFIGLAVCGLSTIGALENKCPGNQGGLSTQEQGMPMENRGVCQVGYTMEGGVCYPRSIFLHVR